jgi:hypothetical protein
VSELSQADVFPLIRGGGLFLVVAGASVMLGALVFRARYAIFGIGAAIAGTLTALYAAPLAAPYGKPRLVEIAFLTAAVVLEMVILATVLRRSSAYDDRHTMLTILTIVGGHFVLMAPAFGPIVMWLAGASVLNTFLALVWRGYSSTLVWAVDGALKLVAGALMFYGHKLPCTTCVSFAAT